MQLTNDLPFDFYDLISVRAWMGMRSVKRVGRSNLWIWLDGEYVSDQTTQFRAEYKSHPIAWALPDHNVKATCAGYNSATMLRILASLTKVKWIYSKTRKNLEVTFGGNSMFMTPTEHLLIQRDLADPLSPQYNFIDLVTTV